MTESLAFLPAVWENISPKEKVLTQSILIYTQVLSFGDILLIRV